MTFEQVRDSKSNGAAPAYRGNFETAFNIGVETACPTLINVCKERNRLQVENLKLRKAIKDIRELFEVSNDNRK